jgi:hypothetical protein
VKDAMTDLMLIAEKSRKYQHERIFSYKSVISLIRVILQFPVSNETGGKDEILYPNMVKDERLWDICMGLIDLSAKKGEKLIQKKVLELVPVELTGEELKDQLQIILKIDRINDGAQRRIEKY